MGLLQRQDVWLGACVSKLLRGHGWNPDQVEGWLARACCCRGVTGRPCLLLGLRPAQDGLEDHSLLGVEGLARDDDLSVCQSISQAFRPQGHLGLRVDDLPAALGQLELLEQPALR